MPSIIGYADVIGFEDVGYDDIEGDDIVGARRGQRRRQRRREGRRGQGPAAKENALAAKNYGSPMTMGQDLIASSQRIEPFGLGTGTFAASSAAGAAVILSAITQKPIQALALVLQAAFRDTAATPEVIIEPLSAVNVFDVKMGTASQFAGVSSVPGTFYTPTNFWGGQVYTPVGGGVTVSVTLSLARALAATQTLLVNGAFRVVSAQQ